MSKDLRASMFAQASRSVDAPRVVDAAAEPSVERRPVGTGKYQGRPQMNFGVDPDVQIAIRFARAIRNKSNSEICNEALRAYLAPEIEKLSVEGLV